MNNEHIKVFLSIMFVTLLGIANVEGAIYFIHPDHLGAPQAVTDQAGVIKWRAEFDPFGKANNLTSTLPAAVSMNIRFPGQYYDAETGLQDNYFRTYDPLVGRYLQSDPIGLEGGLNTYAYANNNPILFKDPLGLLSLTFGAGGSFMFLPSSGSADSGVAVGSGGSLCVYSTVCAGAGWHTPLAGTLGLVGSIGAGSVCGGTYEYTVAYWSGGQGLVGQGQVATDRSVSRGIIGVGGSPEGLAGGAGLAKCVTTYICPFEADECSCRK